MNNIIEIKAENLGGESIIEAPIKKVKGLEKGKFVNKDEVLFVVDSDKTTLEITAPESGIIEDIFVNNDQVIKRGEVLASLNKTDSDKGENLKTGDKKESYDDLSTKKNAPSAVKMMAEKSIDSSDIQGSVRGGRISKADVLQYLDYTTEKTNFNTYSRNEGSTVNQISNKTDREERVKMSKIRQIIAARLKESQNTAAILTTFNEIDMKSVMDLRTKYKEQFEKKYKIKLGFMSFFIKAAILALKEIPLINAEIKGDEIIYKNYYDIGIAVGTEKGLVVPVIRDADKLSFAELEMEISTLGKKAREGKLQVSDMTGATFTITNGGVYGSLFSTPIINPPQSGILGMHSIQNRPIAVNNEIVIRPMMYTALSYDHRIVDGQGAVTFLVRIKQYIEDPNRIALTI